MNALLVSGIWPPDVGGPASHAPAVAEALVQRGHGVEIVTTADHEPAPAPYHVRWVARSLPAGVRHAEVARTVAAAARHADVVYATTMIRRAAAGAAVARRPLVVKLVADEAYERARRDGRFTGTLEEYQRGPGGPRDRAFRRSRTRALRQARRVFVPSAYLLEVAAGWGLDRSRLSVLPNPAPPVDHVPSRADARAALDLDPIGVVLAFAGRLTAQKRLESAFAALAGVPDATLIVLGDGPERTRLEREAEALGVGSRVRFLGGGSRDDVLRLFRAADCSVLPSAWENFPHTVVESLAVGTPVLATAVGGVPEVVVHGVNGLLVPAGNDGAFAAALAEVSGDEALRSRLASAAADSVATLSESVLLGRVVDELERVVAS